MWNKALTRKWAPCWSSSRACGLSGGDSCVFCTGWVGSTLNVFDGFCSFCLVIWFKDIQSSFTKKPPASLVSSSRWRHVASQGLLNCFTLFDRLSEPREAECLVTPESFAEKQAMTERCWMLGFCSHKHLQIARGFVIWCGNSEYMHKYIATACYSYILAHNGVATSYRWSPGKEAARDHWARTQETPKNAEQEDETLSGFV